MTICCIPATGKKLLGAVVCSLFALPAAAEISDTIHPYVAAAINYDDNLLRRDMAADPGAEYSDTYRSSIVGVTVERPIGRQLLTANARVTKVSFDRFSDLDYTGKDGSADLAWHVGNHWQGHLGGKYSESLASFSDFHSSQLNLRTQKTSYVNGTWQFHPSWQIRAGYNRDIFHFDLAAQSYNNRTEEISEAGFDYLARSGSTIGLLFRRLKGTYPSVSVPGIGLIDNDFQQTDANLNVNWLASGVTQVMFLGGWARRTHEAGGTPDASGGHGRLVVSWAPLSHVQFSGSLWREFNVAEGTLISNGMAIGESLGIAWAPTAKLAFNAQLQNEKREFFPRAGVANVTGLSDTSRTASLGVNYAVWRSATLGLSTFSTMRDGSKAAGTTSYRAKGVGFTASIKF